MRSLRGLDSINFLMADVRDGVGPYLSVFLKGGHHWDPGAIGVAMAASAVATPICQVPAGSGLCQQAGSAHRAVPRGSRRFSISTQVGAA